ncbi:DUF2913 family protein [Vibrio sp. Evd11]|uniref:DUF2913 family protein n=1 Tax=Vibrio sp. Evd11 TaxID=1207404 RepID=UPI000EFCF7FF|nr:DUF2913 family protein [Vibrio sp. Evd11]
MQNNHDPAYYRNISTLTTNTLLHLLCKVSMSNRFVPITKRNEILIKYLKPKLTDKSFSNIKNEIKLMINLARASNGNLEFRLYELNAQTNRTNRAGSHFVNKYDLILPNP